MVIYSRSKKAWLAQLVEQRTENPRVSGSIPEPGTYKKKKHWTNPVLLFVIRGKFLMRTSYIIDWIKEL